MTKPGGLYRTNYALPADPEFRVRLYALYRLAIPHSRDHEVDDVLRLWVGTRFKRNGAWYDVEGFIAKEPLTNVISLATVAYGLMPENPKLRSGYVNTLRRIVAEENLLYDVDEKAGFHPKVDQEFGRVINAAIAALDLPRLGAVRAAFEGAQKKLTAGVPDYKGAVRDLFVAVETAFRLACDNKQTSIAIASTSILTGSFVM
jgi:hypothetical protein